MTELSKISPFPDPGGKGCRSDFRERREAITAKTAKRRTWPIPSVLILVLFVAVPCIPMDGWGRDRILEDRNAQWQITAERMSYHERDSLYIAEGGVTITRDSQVLSAQKAIYNEKTGIVQVSGNVRLEVNGDVLTGEMGIFDLNSHNGQITSGRLFMRENHFYVSGKAMLRVGPNTYEVRGCRLTTCDGESPAWSVTGSEVRITMEGYGTVKDVAFRIAGFPVFYIPYAIFPAKTKRQTGLLPPRLGYSDRNGAEVEVPFFWALSDQMDATFYERFMSKRGLMQGFEFRYVAEGPSKGIFLFDILSDRIKEKDLGDPEEADLSPFERTNRMRYWLRSRTDQALPMGVQARLDTDFVSDQDYLKEFRGGLFGHQTRGDLEGESGRPLEDVNSPTRRSALRLSRDGRGYSLQASASYHQRPEDPAIDDTPQPLAGLHFTALPRPLSDSPLFFGFDGEHDYIWRDTGRKGHRISLSPSLSYPMWFGPYLEFEPSLGLDATTQWFDSSEEGGDSQTRDVYRFETRLSSVVERIFDFQWGSVTKLKHKVTPALTYTYRGYNDEEKERPWFEPLDEEGRTNRVTLSIENLLDARKEDGRGGITYAQWGTFSLSQAYDMHEARRDQTSGSEKRPFEPLVGILTLKPFPALNFDAEARWDHDENDFSFADLSLELAVNRSAGRRDTYQIDYQYAKGEDKAFNYSFNFHLLYGFSAGASQKRDLDRRHNMEKSYWIDYETQCWGVRLISEKLDEVDSIMVAFRLLGLGEL